MDEVTRRDLFAMAALQGLLSGPTMIGAPKLAIFSYQIADAMIFESSGGAEGEAIEEPSASAAELAKGSEDGSD